jgi:hypothetical protein
MRPACDSLYDDAEGFGKWGRDSSPREFVLDTKLASRDVVGLEIFILAEPIGACEPLAMSKHQALFQ